MAQVKPVAKLVGQDGNIFNLMGIASRALKQAGLEAEATKMRQEIMSCRSYDEALATIMDYVEVE